MSAFTKTEIVVSTFPIVTLLCVECVFVLVPSINLSAFKVPSGEIAELLLIDDLVLIQLALLKSSDWVIKFVDCGSNNQLPHPLLGTTSWPKYSFTDTLST